MKQHVALSYPFSCTPPSKPKRTTEPVEHVRFGFRRISTFFETFLAYLWSLLEQSRYNLLYLSIASASHHFTEHRHYLSTNTKWLLLHTKPTLSTRQAVICVCCISLCLFPVLIRFQRPVSGTRRCDVFSRCFLLWSVALTFCLLVE